MISDIIDLSGKIVKWVRLKEVETVMIMPHDLLFFYGFESTLAGVTNPATGAVHLLPDDLADENTARGLHQRDYYDDNEFLVRQVASTSEYKVLRILSSVRNGVPDLCEVFTLGSTSNGNARWKGKQPPPDYIELAHWSSVVMDGVVYLIMLSVGESFFLHNMIVNKTG